MVFPVGKTLPLQLPTQGTRIFRVDLKRTPDFVGCVHWREPTPRNIPELGRSERIPLPESFPFPELTRRQRGSRTSLHDVIAEGFS
jgi:hypothetical protein